MGKRISQLTKTVTLDEVTAGDYLAVDETTKGTRKLSALDLKNLAASVQDIDTIRAGAKKGTTAVQPATLTEELAKKQTAVAGKGLSTNDFTDAAKAKLSGIEEGAQANVIESIMVNGYKATISAKEASVTIPVAAGDGSVSYVHPSFTAHDPSAVKVGNDANGHVVLGAPLSVEDVSGLEEALASKQEAVSALSAAETLPYKAAGSASILYTGTAKDGLVPGKIYKYVGEASRKEEGHKYLWTTVGSQELYSETPYPDVAVGDVLLAYANGVFTSTTTVASKLDGTLKFTITTASGLTLVSQDPSWEGQSPYTLGVGLKEVDGTLSVVTGSGISASEAKGLEVDFGTTNTALVDTIEASTPTADPAAVASLMDF